VRSGRERLEVEGDADVRARHISCSRTPVVTVSTWAGPGKRRKGGKSGAGLGLGW
jgi:hypothetical protein